MTDSAGPGPDAPMTTRQRLLAVAQCRACDHVPVSPSGLGRLDPDGEAAAELVRTCDPFIMPGGGTGMFSIFGGRNCREQWREEGRLRRCVLETPGGQFTCAIRKTEVASYMVEFPCKCPADLERFLSIPFEPIEPDLGRYRKACRRYGEEAFVLLSCPDGICMPAELMSPEQFCLLWADAPDLMTAAVAEATRRVAAYVESACRSGVQGFRLVGGEYASTQLGPQAFQELIVEPDRLLVELMHRHGTLAYYHNHGPMMRYLEPIARIGVDMLDPLEMPPYGDMDLTRAREIIAGRYCIVGTFDDMEMLGKWPVEKVLEGLRERLRCYGTRGICIGGSASGTYTERTARAFCALVEAVRQMQD